MSEHSIRSRDGTRIVYEQHGSGPALVMVHGGFVDRSFWGPSQPLLARHFTVYVMDRRGHGMSDPYPADHNIEREYEDVLALIDMNSGPVAMLGHSSGALVALHAARLASEGRVQRVVMYEPPRFEAFTPAIRAQLHASLAVEDLEGIVATVLIDAVEATLNADLTLEARQQMLAGLRRSPVWSAALRNARSIPAEVDSYATYRFDPVDFQHFRTPAVLLLGSTGSPVMKAWVHELQATLPGSHTVLLEGQAHAAMLAAPELFVRTVREAIG
jgi:pimeloyl-ACP methyl ester carboxylesterase